MRLRKALLPLHVVAKILCINPLSLKHMRPSKFGTILTVCQAVGYAVFHLWMVNRDMSTELTKNLVRQLIDSYNRYSGFLAFCFLVITSIFTQTKMSKVVRNIENVDQVFEKMLNVVIDNRPWMRDVLLEICLCIVAISILEWRNCLMYIQDSVPFSEYCLFICLVPLYVIGITETQFFAYLQLIRHRLRALNKLLLHFSRIQNSDANANNTNFATVGQDKSYSFEYFRNEHNRFGSSHLFRNPNTNCLRLDLNSVAKGNLSNMDKPIQSTNFTEQIMQIQRIFATLERTVIIYKSAFSPHLIVILVMKFTTLTSLLYFCCMIIIKVISGIPLSNENKDQLLSSWAWIGAFFVEIFLLCYSSSLMRDESNKIGCNLHTVATNLNSINSKIKIKAFSVQLLFHRIEINPFEFFQLDLNFMYGMIGSIVMNVIILIQFDLAQKAQQNNSTSPAVATNSTQRSA